MTKLDINKYRADYAKSLEWDKPFYIERPAVFSPAAAAQEGNGACAMMWRFISEWLPWQYTNFIDESLSFHETAYQYAAPPNAAFGAESGRPPGTGGNRFTDTVVKSV